MKTVFTTGGKNQFTNEGELITVTQAENKIALFTVTYGFQVKANLTYSEACKEIGECILHNACCEGLASNEGAI